MNRRHKERKKVGDLGSSDLQLAAVLGWAHLPRQRGPAAGVGRLRPLRARIRRDRRHPAMEEEEDERSTAKARPAKNEGVR